MGVAVRSAGGEMKLLTGNQIGSLLAYYRAKTLFDQGVLNSENASRGVIIKTFVTTDLQKAIAEKFGLRCVETLTGFKYIGAKLEKYERAVPLPEDENYRDLPEEETRRLRLVDSSFYIFGGEESYGYSGADFVRDKDGNGAAIMFCEVAAYAKSRGLTIDGLLDQVYAQFGYYLEKTARSLSRARKARRKSSGCSPLYVSNPPDEMLGSKVIARQEFRDRYDLAMSRATKSRREKMLIFELADQTRVAVRGSGTEPKIKYYLFAQRRPDGSEFTRAGARGHQTAGGRKAGGALGVAAGRCRESRSVPTSDRNLAPRDYRKFSQPLLDIRPSTATIPRVSEIKLSGGEITILKTLGLSWSTDGGHAVGGSYREEMEGAEFLDTLDRLDRAGLRCCEQGQYSHHGFSQGGLLSRQCGHFPRIARERSIRPGRCKPDTGTAPAAVLIIE